MGCVKGWMIIAGVGCVKGWMIIQGGVCEGVDGHSRGKLGKGEGKVWTATQRGEWNQKNRSSVNNLQFRFHVQ